jgi:hypothetical protein
VQYCRFLLIIELNCGGRHPAANST